MQPKSELLELTSFLALVSKVLKDKLKGGFSKMEMFALLPLFDDAMKAFEGIEKIPGQELSSEQLDTLKEQVLEGVGSFVDDTGDLELYVDCAIEIIPPIVKLLTSFDDEDAPNPPQGEKEA